MKLFESWRKRPPAAVQEESTAIETTIPTEEPRVEAVKPSPVEVLNATRISFSINFWEEPYVVEATDFFFCANSTRARVAIASPKKWRVESGQLILTCCGAPRNCEDGMIAAFANAGMRVKREFIRECLDPLILLVLEGEKEIYTY